MRSLSSIGELQIIISESDPSDAGGEKFERGDESGGADDGVSKLLSG